MVLAGPSGGDVSTLIGLGATPKNIVAVDMDADAARQARERWSSHGVTVEHSDALSASKRHRGRFDVVFLDFCCRLSDGLATDFVRTVSHGCKSDALAGVGFSYGIGERKSGIRDEAFGLCEPDDLAEDKRCVWLSMRCTELNMRWGTPRVRLMFQASYKSCELTGRGGTPMVYTLGTVERGRGFLEYERAIDRERAAFGDALLVSVKVPPGAMSRSRVRRICTGNSARRMSTAQLGMIFDVPEAQVRAWRAVATREARATAVHEAAE
jgi:hypothetical protein